MKKIHETIYILYKCNKNIQTVWEGLDKHQEKVLFSIHHFTHNLAYYMILEVVSFFDEYSKCFVESKVENEYKKRIKNTRRMIKPIIGRIDQWKDLKKFRDNIIAHPWREKELFTLPQKKFMIFHEAILNISI